MTGPTWSAVDDSTADLLHLVADVERPTGRDVPALFLAACRADALANGGLVSVNRVRAQLAEADIPPRRYSSLWAHYTGKGKPMLKAERIDPETGERRPIWEECKGSTSGNDGRPFVLRRWVG